MGTAARANVGSAGPERLVRRVRYAAPRTIAQPRQIPPARPGCFGRRASPPEDLARDSALDVVPGLQRLGSRFERLDAPLNFCGPGLFSAGIGRAVQTGQQLSCDFSASFCIEPEGVNEHGFSSFGHGLILPFGLPLNKRLHLMGTTGWSSRIKCLEPFPADDFH